MFIDNYKEIQNCIVIDTETVTDQSCGISKVWEVGIVVIKDVDIVDTKEWLVLPDAKFEKLDLIYNDGHLILDAIKNSPKFLDIFHEMESYLDADFIVGGHNVDYDLKILNRELTLIDKPLIGSKKFDTIRLAKKVHPEWSKFNLDYLCDYYGLKIKRRHRALDDAYATAEAFLKMREKYINDLESKKADQQIGLF